MLKTEIMISQKILYKKERTNPIMLVTNPAVLMLFGKIFFCFTEKIIPRTPKIIPKKGTQQKIVLEIPRIKLAIPRLLDFFFVIS